eukprot:73795_1
MNRIVFYGDNLPKYKVHLLASPTAHMSPNLRRKASMLRKRRPFQAQLSTDLEYIDIPVGDHPEDPAHPENSAVGEHPEDSAHQEDSPVEAHQEDSVHQEDPVHQEDSAVEAHPEDSPVEAHHADIEPHQRYQNTLNMRSPPCITSGIRGTHPTPNRTAVNHDESVHYVRVIGTVNLVSDEKKKIASDWVTFFTPTEYKDAFLRCMMSDMFEESAPNRHEHSFSDSIYFALKSHFQHMYEGSACSGCVFEKFNVHSAKTFLTIFRVMENDVAVANIFTNLILVHMSKSSVYTNILATFIAKARNGHLYPAKFDKIATKITKFFGAQDRDMSASEVLMVKKCFADALKSMSGKRADAFISITGRQNIRSEDIVSLMKKLFVSIKKKIRYIVFYE